MATHHARSVLAALAIGAALTTAGCTAEPASSSNSPASAERPGSDSGADDRSGSSDSLSPRKPRAPKTRTAPVTPERRPSPRWCTTDALSVSLRPEQPAAGSRYASLLLTNSSGTACRTRGWPGLQLMGEDGEKIPTEVVRDDSEPSRPLTLAAGERSSARLHWTSCAQPRRSRRRQVPRTGVGARDPAGPAHRQVGLMEAGRGVRHRRDRRLPLRSTRATTSPEPTPYTGRLDTGGPYTGRAVGARGAPAANWSAGRRCSVLVGEDQIQLLPGVVDDSQRLVRCSGVPVAQTCWKA